MRKTNSKGMSLVEILIVIAIFAVLGILVTQAIVLTLRTSQKSESLVRARENLNYSLSVIERQIRNASSVTPCTGISSSRIDYFDQNGKPGSFACENINQDGSYIASGSSRLTNAGIKVVSCSFTCTESTGANPSLITIGLTLKDASASATQVTNVSADTEIFLRNY